MRRFSYLYSQLVRRELRQKYKGSALGVVWYLVNPLVLAGAYWLMFTRVLIYRQVPDYPLFLLVGIAVWTFFSQAVLAAAGSLLDQAALVRKVRFPREIVTASVVSVQAVIFCVLLGLLVPVTVAIRGTLEPALLLLPALVVALGAFVLGIALGVAVLHAYFRDVGPILGAAMFPWFLITPIFFSARNYPGLGHHPLLGDLLRWANPVAPFVEAVRDVVYAGRVPDPAVLAYVAVAGGLALALGRLLFRRMEGELAVVL